MRTQTLQLARTLAVGLAALSVTGSVALSQAPVQREIPPVARTVNLTLEQIHTIKELLKDSKVEKAPADVKVDIGGQVPDKIALHEVPAEIGAKVPQIKTHRFFLTQSKIVLVDPKEPRISEIIN
jgi:Protein of unknown function (DUF1236)